MSGSIDDKIKLLNAREKVADKMVKRFSAERIVYLILTTISCIGILILIYYYIAKDRIDLQSALSFLGPTGIIGLSMAGLFRMFDKVLTKVMPDDNMRP